MSLVWTLDPGAAAGRYEEADGGSQPDVEKFPITFDTPNLSSPVDTFAVTAVDDGAGTVSIEGDHTALFPDGAQFTIAGSTGNDGAYQVVSTAFAAGATTITVASLADPTVDGTVGAPTGVEFFTPTSDEVASGIWLLDAWFEIDTAWDGTSPGGDIGTYLFASEGLFVSHEVIDMTQADEDGAAYGYGGAGLLYNPHTNNTSLLVSAANQNIRLAPLRFTDVNPLRVKIMDGFSDPGSTVGSAVLCYRLGRA